MGRIILPSSYLGRPLDLCPSVIRSFLSLHSWFDAYATVVTNYTTAREIYGHLSKLGLAPTNPFCFHFTFDRRRLLWTDTVGSVGLGPMSHLFLRLEVPGGATGMLLQDVTLQWHFTDVLKMPQRPPLLVHAGTAILHASTSPSSSRNWTNSVTLRRPNNRRSVSARTSDKIRDLQRIPTWKISIILTMTTAVVTTISKNLFRMMRYVRPTKYIFWTD